MALALVPSALAEAACALDDDDESLCDFLLNGFDMVARRVTQAATARRVSDGRRETCDDERVKRNAHTNESIRPLKWKSFD